MADVRRRTVFHDRYEEISLLFELSQLLDQSMDLNLVIQPVLMAAADRLGFFRAAVTLLDRQTGEIFIEAAYGLSKTQKERERYRLGEGITGQVVQSGQARVIPLVAEDPSFLNRTGAHDKRSNHEVSFICVPIKLGNETIGAFSIDRSAADEGELQDNVRLISIIASLIAQAVHIRQSVMEEK
ncbi:MAG: GAF domain-containing protein, partial [Spirochaetia bacterium]